MSKGSIIARYLGEAASELGVRNRHRGTSIRFERQHVFGCCVSVGLVPTLGIATSPRDLASMRPLNTANQSIED